MRRRGLVVSLVLLVGLATACGGNDNATSTGDATTSSETSSVSSPEPGSSTPGASATQPVEGVPDRPITLLADGSTVSFESLTTDSRPTLLWFWAPHCVFCRREAPDLVSFAAAHGDEITIIGVGAQDTLEEAHDFLDDTATSDLTMAWDPTGATWIDYGVTNQPAIVMLDADGEETGRWFRDFDESELTAAAGLG